MSTVYELIRQAIVNKEQVIAMYDGYMREMCPHAIGKFNGSVYALFFQFGGDGISRFDTDGDSENWHCIPIDQLAHISIRKGAWHTGRNHVSYQMCMETIDAEVSF